MAAVGKCSARRSPGRRTCRHCSTCFVSRLANYLLRHGRRQSFCRSVFHTAATVAPCRGKLAILLDQIAFRCGTYAYGCAGLVLAQGVCQLRAIPTGHLTPILGVGDVNDREGVAIILSGHI